MAGNAPGGAPSSGGKGGLGDGSLWPDGSGGVAGAASGGAAGSASGGTAGSASGGAAGSASGGAAGSGAGGTAGAAGCKLDTEAYDPAGKEIVCAYAKKFSWTGSTLDTGFPKDLASMNHYAATGGPCAGKNYGGCSLDTLSFSPAGVELVTAYGQKWSWTSNVLDAGFPKDLTAIARYAAAGGPCAGKAAGTCRFDTLTYSPAGSELVTAYGKKWSWTGSAVDTGFPKDLTAIARYAATGGPCAGKAAGTCAFDTETYSPSGSELVTAYGQKWSWTGSTLDVGFPKSLSSIARYGAAQGGPCGP